MGACDWHPRTTLGIQVQHQVPRVNKGQYMISRNNVQKGSNSKMTARAASYRPCGFFNGKVFL
ncbi:MAG: hypothetical protein GX754_00150 [Clostridiaceae bacterium]|nr:hypothetical protein [Clostridiaceae bacterium]